MAKLIDLLTFSGKVGDMVGCKGAHGFYIRSRPKKTALTASPKQLEVRARLALVMGFLKPLKAIIHEGFSGTYPLSNKVSAMNAAASHVLNHGLVGDYPDLSINPAEVRLTRGTSGKLSITKIRLSGTSVGVFWSPAVTSFSGYADDCVRVVVYNPEEKTVMANEATRETGEATVDVSDEPPGSELLVYVYVSDRDEKQFSNSQFLGKVVLDGQY